jgi:hypothetical protein
MAPSSLGPLGASNATKFFEQAETAVSDVHAWMRRLPNAAGTVTTYVRDSFIQTDDRQADYSYQLYKPAGLADTDLFLDLNICRDALAAISTHRSDSRGPTSIAAFPPALIELLREGFHNLDALGIYCSQVNVRLEKGFMHSLATSWHRDNVAPTRISVNYSNIPAWSTMVSAASIDALRKPGSPDALMATPAKMGEFYDVVATSHRSPVPSDIDRAFVMADSLIDNELGMCKVPSIAHRLFLVFSCPYKGRL